MQTVNSDRSPVPVPGTNGLTAPLGGWVDMNATGYAPDSSVAAYLVPRTQVRARAGLVPREATGVIALGMAAVDSSGSSLHAFGIPTDLASGEYVLQINGIAENNTVRSVNVDMQVTAPRTSTPRVMVGACSFPGASVTLTRECRVSLSALASSTGRGASPVRVQITGVAYGRDTIVENRSLARDRAQAITRYLDRLGVDAVAKIATVTKIGVSPGLTMQPAPVLASSDGRPASTVALTVPPPT